MQDWQSASKNIFSNTICYLFPAVFTLRSISSQHLATMLPCQGLLSMCKAASAVKPPTLPSIIPAAFKSFSHLGASRGAEAHLNSVNEVLAYAGRSSAQWDFTTLTPVGYWGKICWQKWCQLMKNNFLAATMLWKLKLSNHKNEVCQRRRPPERSCMQCFKYQHAICMDKVSLYNARWESLCYNNKEKNKGGAVSRSKELRRHFNNVDETVTS